MNNEDILKSIQFSKLIAWAFSLSVAIIFISYSISKYLNDWMWFARSGSLLVCIGVLTAAYDIKGKMENSNAPNVYKSQTIILEAAILIIGTLIWGFGDLVGCFYR